MNTCIGWVERWVFNTICNDFVAQFDNQLVKGFAIVFHGGV